MLQNNLPRRRWQRLRPRAATFVSRESALHFPQPGLSNPVFPPISQLHAEAVTREPQPRYRKGSAILTLKEHGAKINIASSVSR